MSPKTEQPVSDSNGPATQSHPAGETVSGYFRRVFEENPKLLKKRSNRELYRRWLADHPGEPEVPLRVKQGLANVKSLLRGKLLNKRVDKNASPAAAAEPNIAPTHSRELASLEERIDDCLTLAKSLDRDGLAEVIRQLRRARNSIVLKIGQ